MDKFLYSLVFIFCSFSINVKSQDSIGQIQTLVQRVDSLEHELSYLKLIYELKTLNSDMAILKHEVDIKSNTIQLFIYDKNFDARLYETFQRYYESCQKQKEAYFELIGSMKDSFAIKVVAYHFTERELNILMLNYEIISQTYDLLEPSMNTLKLIIEMYGKSL